MPRKIVKKTKKTKKHKSVKKKVPKKGVKKSAARRVSKTPKKKIKISLREEKPIGSVTHFFGNIKVAVVRFRIPIRVGTKVSFRGATTDFTQTLSSLQYNHKQLSRAPKGKEVGVKLVKRVRQGDKVYLEK